MKKLKILLLLTLLNLSHLIQAQVCNNNITANTPDSRFIVSGEEVLDTITGLVWQRCSLGQSGSNCSGSPITFSWKAALQSAQSERQQTGKQWHLPNIKELYSIVDNQCYSPSINLTIFPYTARSIYWSASPTNSSLYRAMQVGFSSGSLSTSDKDFTKYVRLVRTGQ